MKRSVSLHTQGTSRNLDVLSPENAKCKIHFELLKKYERLDITLAKKTFVNTQSKKCKYLGQQKVLLSIRFDRPARFEYKY